MTLRSLVDTRLVYEYYVGGKTYQLYIDQNWRRDAYIGRLQETMREHHVKDTLQPFSWQIQLKDKDEIVSIVDEFLGFKGGNDERTDGSEGRN